MSETHWDAELDLAVGRYWTARNRRIPAAGAVENTFDCGTIVPAPEKAQPPGPLRRSRGADGYSAPPDGSGEVPVDDRNLSAAGDNPQQARR